MAGLRNKEFVMVVPGLTKKQAMWLRNNLVLTTKTIAPNSKSSIAIGRKKNMETIISRCNKGLSIQHE